MTSERNETPLGVFGADEMGVQRKSSFRVVRSPTPLEMDGRVSRQDSLSGTREYYGLTPMAGPSTSASQTLSNTHRSKSTSNRPTRSLSNASSRHPSVSRPTSPESRRMSSSTIRSVIPLPLHRGFLSPQKPKAAIRLEERQRQASMTRDRTISESQHHPETEQEMNVVDIISEEERGRISEEAGMSKDFHPQTDVRAQGNTDLEVDIGDDPPTAGSKSSGAPSAFAENLYGRPPNIRHSLAEVSSQHQTHAEYSSDNLVPTRNGLRPPNGLDIEKGPSRLGRSPTSRRPSYNERRSSSHRHTRQSDSPQRRYQLFENPLSTFLLGGHLMTGGDNYFSVGLVMLLLFGITGVWFGTTGIWYWTNAGAYGMVRGGGIAINIVFVYLFGLTFSSFLAASLREPGIIPRDLDPNPPMAQGETESWHQPLDREFAVKQGRVVVRYCETCRSYRPPRSSHCRLCGNCVDGIDHHCSYLHTCVGKRTYLAFITLLVSAGISAIYQVVFSALHFSLLCHGDSIGFGTAIQRSPGAAVSFLIGVLVLPGIGFLMVYHFRLLLYNLTTVEQIRASASSNLLKATKRPDNPFAADSVLSNILLSTLGRPQFPSWVQAWRVVEPERRSVNPALTEERWIKLGYDKGMR